MSVLVAVLVGGMVGLLVVPALGAARLAGLRAPERRWDPWWSPRWGGGRPRRPRRGDVAATVVELHGVLTTELRCGHAPATALANAMDQVRDRGEQLGRLGVELRAVGDHARAGHDPVDALRRAARLPGAEELRHLAACWQVSARGGAALAPVVAQVTDTLRAEAEQRRELRAQLAGPRATSVLLATLPVVGLVMGAGLSTRPLAFLLTTPVGMVCLFAGIGLELLGLLWTRRIVRGALGRAPRRPDER